MEDPLGLVGQKIDDKYVVEAIVGEGGFAIVYRAQHLIFKRPVAIKVFRALSDFGAEQRERLLDEFIQEGKLLAELSERSVAIVQARDVGKLTTPAGEWIPYMVLEWLDGASLDDVLRREQEQSLPPRSVDAAVRLLDPVAEALALAHKRGIAHRDVKPANIFLIGDPRGEDCTVKLLDFGIAKVVQDAQKLAISFNKTQGHVTSFTPAYGAPEQFSRTHGATGPWTDVFALALVAGEVLTQQAPLQGDDFVQLGFAASNPAARPTPRKLGATISDAAEAVFEKALAISPQERFQSAGEFWGALRQALAMSPMRTSPAPSELSNASTIAAPPAAIPVSSPALSRSGNPPTQDPVVAAPRAAGGRTAVVAGALVLALAAGTGITLTVFKGKSAPPPAPSATASIAPPTTSASAPPAAACPPGMIRIQGGEFFMGSSDPRALDNEKPPHSVKLTTYCIDRTEVTVSAYKACSDGGRCIAAGRRNFFDGYDALAPKAKTTLDALCNINQPEAKAKHPINCVDWEQAANFCQRRGGRLPTEAEWEFAARGPDGRAYPWGDEPPSGRYLNACGSECTAWGKKNHVDGIATFAGMYKDSDPFPTTAPVGSFPDGKSRYGLLDVVGNVWEWTADYYAPYTTAAASDPTGPKTGTDRVARGGAWNGSDPSWVRPTFRFHFAPDSRSYGVGFRCAASLGAQPTKN
jgi:formylglycine-generating enzyme required for sulfatase activity/tRNA A-37 threonylcarbamoyl transferase component Bud32